MDLRANVVDYMQDRIYDCVLQSAARREFIYVDKYFRGVGKTTALVKFANHAKLYLVVPNDAVKYYILSNFDMKRPVISQHEITKLRGKKDAFVVFDEGVDPSKLSDFNVITGFVNR